MQNQIYILPDCMPDDASHMRHEWYCAILLCDRELLSLARVEKYSSYLNLFLWNSTNAIGCCHVNDTRQHTKLICNFSRNKNLLLCSFPFVFVRMKCVLACFVYTILPFTQKTSIRTTAAMRFNTFFSLVSRFVFENPLTKFQMECLFCRPKGKCNILSSILKCFSIYYHENVICLFIYNSILRARCFHCLFFDLNVNFR